LNKAAVPNIAALSFNIETLKGISNPFTFKACKSSVKSGLILTN